MGNDYIIGKEMAELKSDIHSLQSIIQELVEVISYNMKKGNLEEPKEKKRK